jgi:uncharacterized protein YdeI (BOF family)
MSKKIRYILIFLVLALIAAVAVWKYTFKESESNVASHKTDVTIDAPSLLQAFESNEDSANLKYRNKIILVSGIVGSVSKDTLGYSVYLKEKDAISGIICSFDKASFDSVQIKPGAQINVKGICMGYLMDVQMNKCNIAKNITK